MREKILEFLKDNPGWHKPTKIAIAIGYNPDLSSWKTPLASHSAKVCPILKRLVEQKLVKKKYFGLYSFGGKQR